VQLETPTEVAAPGDAAGLGAAGGAPVVYEPRRSFKPRLRDLWLHRDLAFHLGWGYVRKRYSGTWLGWLWIPLRPTIDMLTRALVFGGFLGVQSGDRPYIIYLMIGTGAWLFFDRAAYWGYRSLQFHRRYLNRAQVPWLAAIAGIVVPGTVEGGLYGLIAVCASVYYKLTQGSFFIAIDRDLVYVLGGLCLLALYAWTVALWTAPLVARARDVRYILRYVFGFWYFLTPVLYPPSSLPPRYRALAEYNPVSAPISWVQHGLLQTNLPSRSSVLVSVAVLVVALPLGLVFFSRAEHKAHARL
jgi:homopolymeric O-antigen transport system permease protein